MLSHAVLVGLMAFSTDLRLLLLLRIVQGCLGGISTIGLIIVSAISTQEQLPRRMGTYQSALTLGQIFSPPLGAMAAATFGFRGAFLATSLMMFVIFLYCRLGLSPIPPRPRPVKGGGIPRRQLLLAWLLSFAGTIQIVFLPSILPTILQVFGVAEAQQLVTAGVIVFAYGASAAAGSYCLARLADRVSGHRLLLASAMGASVFQVLLSLGVGPASFTLLRMAQTFLAAGIFPLILSLIAARSGGAAIGFINTARFAGNAAGPLVATFLLTHADLLTLYAVLGAGLAAAAAGQYAGASPTLKNR
jgi:DHA1 family multidrug resistance protein-like MFS transporter